MRLPAESRYVRPATRRPRTCSPGASESGFAKPSSVGPRPENVDIASSVVHSVPLSPYEPAEITNGSDAGDVTVPASGPALPAAATTVTLLNHAASTSADSRSL